MSEHDEQVPMRDEPSDAPARSAESPDSEDAVGPGAPRGAGEISARIHVVPLLFVSGLTAIVVMLIAFSVLSVFAPATLGTLANRVDAPADPKPAWYFLFLYTYLREAPGFVAALVPVVLLVVLALWPFIDRSTSRAPRDRIPALVFGGLVMVAIVVLTYLGWRV